MAGIERNEWARIWARALKDGTFRDKLQKNPRDAVDDFKQNIDHDFPNPNKLIEDITVYEADIGEQFSKMSSSRLNDIFNGFEVVNIKRNKLTKP